MKIQLGHTFEDIICLENLLAAWQEFVVGKRDKPDVQIFSRQLMDELVSLHQELASHSYRHGGYYSFKICDPKPRQIHKASVRDRLVHHAIYRALYPFFDRTFIFDSFACRNGKGTHRAWQRFTTLAWRVSQYNTRTCWILKCDIKKFFASIDQEVLLTMLCEYITDQDIMWLLSEVIGSFHSSRSGIGLPLGNLTSQLFANIYLNALDQFVKHRLKVQQYVRYADDFVLLSSGREWLADRLLLLERFLHERLRLAIHPKKIVFKTFASGVDFLGWVHFSDHRVLRTATKRRMMRRIRESSTPETVQSYLGLLKCGNAFGVKREVLQKFWLSQSATTF